MHIVGEEEHTGADHVLNRHEPALASAESVREYGVDDRRPEELHRIGPAGEAECALVGVGDVAGGEDEGQAVEEADGHALEKVEEHEEADVVEVFVVARREAGTGFC